MSDIVVSEARDHCAAAIERAHSTGEPAYGTCRGRRVAVIADAEQPRSPGCVAMAGELHPYRVRVGGHRIVYEVLGRRLVVQVVQVGHRRDVHHR